MTIFNTRFKGEKKQIIIPLFGMTIAMMASAALFSWVSYAYVLEKAQENITNLLLSHKGIHHYVQNTLIPAYSKYQEEGKIPASFYAPELLSSSFIVRNQHEFYNQERKISGFPALYYKLAANNPRNPVNKADALEKNLIKMFNENPDIKSYKQIVKVDGKKVLYVAIPFLANGAHCMRCHSKREIAPPELQQRYPGQGGFNEKIGEIRAITSIRAPMEHEYYHIYVIGLTIFIGFLAFASLFFFNTRLRALVWERTTSLEQEIAERKRAEEILRKNRSMLEQILNTTPQSIFWKDINGVYLGCNQVFSQAAGLKFPDMIIGKTDFDLPWPKQESEAYRADDQEVIQFNRTKLHIIEPLQQADGSRIWIDTSKVPLLDEQGKVYGVLGVYEDITDKKKAEQDLKIKESAIAASINAIAIADLDGNLTYVNRSLLALWAYENEKEVLGKSAIELWQSKEDALNLMNNLQKTGSWLGEMQARKKDGKTFVAQVSSGMVCSKDGQPLCIMASFLDVTEKHKYEEQIHQTQRLEAIGTLSGGIAHDFNNILFPIVGYAQMLLEDIPEDGPIRNSLKEILISALRGRDLVQQILTFSRQEKKQLTLIKMQPIIKEALKLIRSTIPTTISIDQNLQPDCGPIKADPTQFHQIIMNLATNAYHAMEANGGELKVSLKEIELNEYDLIDPNLKPGLYACLSVSDTGIGMEKDVLNRIFEPFFTTKEKGKGTGMGLSVVHGIVNSMNGAIKAYSEPGRGTQFQVYLPVVRVALENQEPEIKESLTGGSEKILLVDDEEAVILMEKQILNRFGYQVVSYTNSLEALEAFRSGPEQFDLVITDMAMPKMPGDKLAAELIKIRSNIPVLLCTGFSETMTDEKIKSMGIKGFLMKPIMMHDLAKKIRELLD
ncbi:MAG: PAS domain S-box protein [Pseudomonadota bacterium]